MICKLNKFGHCKYGRYCNFKHENKRCQDSLCDARKCDFRHPRKCLYVLQNKPCKFGEVCSFDHGIESDNSLEVKILQLEDLIKAKDVQIAKLMTRISEIERKDFNDNCDDEASEISTTSSEIIEHENEASTSNCDPRILLYHCDCCDYTTKHEVGLKIHKAKAHKYKCEECNAFFGNDDKLARHKLADATLANLDETYSEDYGLLINQHLSDEKCLGVFNTINPRDDNQPVLFLHSPECWDRSVHTCPDLPDSHDYDVDDGVYIDYDFYSPILHGLLDELVYGDTSLPGCYMDWTKIEKIRTEQNA